VTETPSTPIARNVNGKPLYTFARDNLRAEAEQGTINTSAERLTRRTRLP
jgi:hypothetical protein